MRAIVIGARGQDGQYLCQELEILGFDVIGVGSSNNRPIESSHLRNFVHIDMSKKTESDALLNDFKPDAIYHLAAVHAPSHSMSQLAEINLENMKKCHLEISQNIFEWQKFNPYSRSLIALSSQMYRNNPLQSRFINELTSPDAETAYGVTKRRAWESLKQYRRDYGIHSSGLILFNHTSSRSKPGYIFPTLVKKFQDVLEGRTNKIEILNALSELDIVHAQEICRLMPKVLDQNEGFDYVLGRGEASTIREIVAGASELLQVDVEVVSELEPALSKCLISDTTQATLRLDWKPILSASEILAKMVRGED